MRLLVVGEECKLLCTFATQNTYHDKLLMNSLKFKSNIKCNGCLEKVSLVLNQNANIEKWSVDLEHVDRILTVETDKLGPEEIKYAVQKAGFTAEELIE